MDHYFEWYDMSDERCVRFVKMKLIGQAKVFWISVERALERDRVLADPALELAYDLSQNQDFALPAELGLDEEYHDGGGLLEADLPSNVGPDVEEHQGRPQVTRHVESECP
ncbi:hypothetical protein KSP40_PGU019518 [Platanthera guangdongensis]|uniref:Uncharacterized protein n=1 Tax=Platanthera guangdongensis TaxID=2320717 RepID=A0ABR2MIZ5_9ASPA